MRKAFLLLIKLPWIHFDFISLPFKYAQFHKTYRFWVISYFHFLWNFRLSSISTILKFQEKLQKVQIEFWWDKLSHSFPFTFRAWVETTDIPQLLICFTFPSFFGLFNQSFCWVTFWPYKGYFWVGLWKMKSHWEKFKGHFEVIERSLRSHFLVCGALEENEAIPMFISQIEIILLRIFMLFLAW